MMRNKITLLKSALVTVCAVVLASCSSEPIEQDFPAVSKVVEPKIEFSFEGSVSRSGDRQIVLQAAEKSGEGDKVIGINQLRIEKLLDSQGEPLRYALRDYNFGFATSGPKERSGLLLTMVIDTPVKEAIGLFEALAVFQVGEVEEVILSVAPNPEGSLVNPRLEAANVTARGRKVGNLGIQLGGVDSSRVRDVKLSNGGSPVSPHVQSKSGSTSKFGWQNLAELTPDAEIMLWFEGSAANAAPDWVLKPDASTTTKHAEFDISASFFKQMVWKVEVTGEENNLIAAGLFDASGAPAGEKPVQRSSGGNRTIALTGVDGELTLRIRVCPNSQLTFQEVRFENLPIAE